jgi:hypothetical protein
MIAFVANKRGHFSSILIDIIGDLQELISGFLHNLV